MSERLIKPPTDWWEEGWDIATGLFLGLTVFLYYGVR